MNSNSEQIQKPKRKLRYYLRSFFSVLVAVSLTTNHVKWINEIVFGLIILALLRILYDKFTKSTEQNTFEIETHYDKLHSVIMVLLGIGMISFSIMHPDFIMKLNLEWINYLIFGLCFIFSGFNTPKSVRLIAKNSEFVEIEDYELKLNSEIKQIQLFKNKMILSKTETENYEFGELIIDEEVKAKFETWMQLNIPNTNIKVKWNG